MPEPATNAADPPADIPELAPAAATDSHSGSEPASNVEVRSEPEVARGPDEATEAELEPDSAKVHRGRFSFGSYGRVKAAGDATGRPARESDIVAHGSRIDLHNYVELELRRDDHWVSSGADTRFVATLAVGHPIFHYDGEFDAKLAARNLYLEERGLGLKGLGLWVGSRMLRGDDIYLLDFWPLDNLNTLGAGLDYDAPTDTRVAIHMGLGQPSNPFYRAQAERPAPLNQFGAATIDVLDRQRWVGSARIEQQVALSSKAGLEGVLYGELHRLPSGQREDENQAGTFDDLPAENGFVIGAQIGGYTGERNTHLNLFVRYASGLPAYGEFATPTGLALDRGASGAHEVLVAASGNWELGPVAIMAGGYFRSFRNASEALDFGDLDEGIAIFRPHAFFADWAGLAVEASYQAQQRGVLVELGDSASGSGDQSNPEPLIARVSRLAVMPFVVPAGPGSYSRPMFYFVYSAAFRDDGARALYPEDDPFRQREVDHYLGIGAEWWFGSTSYGGE